MPQFLDRTLELRILKTLATTKNKRYQAHIFPKLSLDCFATESAREIYSRFTNIAKTRGVLISWDELQYDLSLKESTRKIIKGFKKKPFDNKELIKQSVIKLHDFKQLRGIYKACEAAFNTLGKDSIDPDKLRLATIEKLQASKHVTEDKQAFVSLGGSDKEAAKWAKSIFAENKNKYIPTGIKVFDEVNRGIPRGAYWTISSQTSGGKSVFANQVGCNMATFGARVCLVQLEMDQLETGQRQMSRLADLDMNFLINTNQLSENQIIKSTEQWLKVHNKIKRNGGVFTVYTPDQELTIEELLFSLEPYEFDVIIVDQITLLKGVTDDDQVKALGRVGRFCKLYAGRKNKVICTVAQLTDDGYIKYARAITEHSQVSMTWKYSGDPIAMETGIVTITMPKARNQKQITMYLRAKFNRMKFEEIDEEELQLLQQQPKEEPRRTRNGSKSNGSKPNNFAAKEDKKELYSLK